MKSPIGPPRLYCHIFNHDLNLNSVQHGISIEEARKECFFMDSKGLVCKSRTDLQHHKIPFAHVSTWGFMYRAPHVWVFVQRHPCVCPSVCVVGGWLH